MRTNAGLALCLGVLLALLWLGCAGSRPANPPPSSGAAAPQVKNPVGSDGPPGGSSAVQEAIDPESTHGTVGPGGPESSYVYTPVGTDR